MESLIDRLRDVQALAKLVGEAPLFLKAIQRLPVMAKSEATVLITGETGTGKELVARAIHYLSKRAAYPFTPVNCGSLPDTFKELERAIIRGIHLNQTNLIQAKDLGIPFEIGSQYVIKRS